jgi:hypothetical protein
MQTIYKIFNPHDGLYIDATSVDDAKEKLVNVIYDFFMAHTHESPYSICEVQDDGSEIWKNPLGEQIFSPDELKRFLMDANKLPVVILGDTNV